MCLPNRHQAGPDGICVDSDQWLCPGSWLQEASQVHEMVEAPSFTEADTGSTAGQQLRLDTGEDGIAHSAYEEANVLEDTVTVSANDRSYTHPNNLAPTAVTTAAPANVPSSTGTGTLVAFGVSILLLMLVLATLYMSRGGAPPVVHADDGDREDAGQADDEHLDDTLEDGHATPRRPEDRLANALRQ